MSDSITIDLTISGILNAQKAQPLSGGSWSITLTGVTDYHSHTAVCTTGAVSLVYLSDAAGGTNNIADPEVVVFISNTDGMLVVVGSGEADNNAISVSSGVPVFVCSSTTAYNATANTRANGSAEQVKYAKFYHAAGGDRVLHVHVFGSS